MGKTFKANDEYFRVKKNKFKSRRFKKKVKTEYKYYDEKVSPYANLSCNQQEDQRRD